MNRAWGIVLFMTFFSAGLIVVSAQEAFDVQSGSNPLESGDIDENYDSVDEDDVGSIGYFLNPFSGNKEGSGIDFFSVISITMGMVAIVGSRVLRLPASATFYSVIFTANLVPITSFFSNLSSMGISIGAPMQAFVGVVIGMALFGGLIDLAR